MEEDRVPAQAPQAVIVSIYTYRRMEALYYVGGLVWLGRCVFGPPPKPLSDTASDSPLGGAMGTWRGERNIENNGSDRHGQGNRADQARQQGQADRIQRQANSTAMSQEDIDRLERGEG